MKEFWDENEIANFLLEYSVFLDDIAIKGISLEQYKNKTNLKEMLSISHIISLVSSFNINKEVYFSYINSDDYDKIFDFSLITFKKEEDKKIFSRKNIISGIRNCLCHKLYKIDTNGNVHLKSLQNGLDVSVQPSFLLLAMFSFLQSRAFPTMLLDDRNIDWEKDEISDVSALRIIRANPQKKQETSENYLRSEDINMKNIFKKYDYQFEPIKLTDKEIEIINDFFSKNRLEKGNMMYIITKLFASIGMSLDVNFILQIFNAYLIKDINLLDSRTTFEDYMNYRKEDIYYMRGAVRDPEYNKYLDNIIIDSRLLVNYSKILYSQYVFSMFFDSFESVPEYEHIRNCLVHNRYRLINDNTIQFEDHINGKEKAITFSGEYEIDEIYEMSKNLHKKNIEKNTDEKIL